MDIDVIESARDYGRIKRYDANDRWFQHMTKTNLDNYYSQKSMALKRNIEWGFNSFEEWLLWWLKTDHFAERGVHGHEYQMCRNNGRGGYTWDNVYCTTGRTRHRRFAAKELEAINKALLNYPTETQAMSRAQVFEWIQARC